MERNKLSARSPILRELGAENTKYLNSNKIRWLFIDLQHILILKLCNTNTFCAPMILTQPSGLHKIRTLLGSGNQGGRLANGSNWAKATLGWLQVMGSRVGWCVVLLANIEVLTIGLPLNFLCQRTLRLYHVTPTFLGVSKETLTKKFWHLPGR